MRVRQQFVAMFGQPEALAPCAEWPIGREDELHGVQAPRPTPLDWRSGRPNPGCSGIGRISGRRSSLGTKVGTTWSVTHGMSLYLGRPPRGDDDVWVSTRSASRGDRGERVVDRVEVVEQSVRAPSTGVVRAAPSRVP